MAEVLYRKYRPQTFGEVLGQEHVVGILEKAVGDGKIAHAYLFAGPRGTGKTSVARILAREAGCAPDDLMEIDGASARGIDEIRELRDAVHILPFRGDRKVYIIDEVHMLTGPAFNALLKTLEEPPAHVIFILATTEPEKVPETVKSRCQSFRFRHVPEDVLTRSLVAVAKREGYTLEPGAAETLALLGEGSLRDAQGYLDQILALGNKRIQDHEVREFLGVPAQTHVDALARALIARERTAALGTITAVVRERGDIIVFLRLLLRSIRERAIAETDPEEQKTLLNILRALLAAYTDTKYAYIQHLPLEVAVMGLTM